MEGTGGRLEGGAGGGAGLPSYFQLLSASLKATEESHCSSLQLLLALSAPAAAQHPLRGPSASQLHPPRWSEHQPSHGPLRGPNVSHAPAQKSDLHQPSSAPLRRPSSSRAAAPREGQAPAVGGPPRKPLGSGNTISSLLLPSPKVSSCFLCLLTIGYLNGPPSALPNLCNQFPALNPLV